MKKLRYACVGAGGIADKKHLNEYIKLGRIEPVAICASSKASANRLAVKYAVRGIYTDYIAMFEKERPDFISICTPNNLHAPIAMAALERGIHVHCEKPLAMNATQVQLIIDTKNRSGSKVMVAMNNRFTPEALFLDDYIQQGLLGEIYHVKCGIRRRNGIPGRGAWFTDKKYSGGGALIDLGVHYLDLMMHFLGFPRIISAYGSTYTKFANDPTRLRTGYRDRGEGIFDVEDMAVGMIRLLNGTTIDFDFNWASNIEKETKYYELLGTKGGAIFRDGELKIFTQCQGASEDIIPEVQSIPPYNEFMHFLDCIENANMPSPSPEEALQIMSMVDGIYCSAQGGCEVRF